MEILKEEKLKSKSIGGFKEEKANSIAVRGGLRSEAVRKEGLEVFKDWVKRRLDGPLVDSSQTRRGMLTSMDLGNDMKKAHEDGMRCSKCGCGSVCEDRTHIVGECSLIIGRSGKNCAKL